MNIYSLLKNNLTRLMSTMCCNLLILAVPLFFVALTLSSCDDNPDAPFEVHAYVDFVEAFGSFPVGSADNPAKFFELGDPIMNGIALHHEITRCAYPTCVVGFASHDLDLLRETLASACVADDETQSAELYVYVPRGFEDEWTEQLAELISCLRFAVRGVGPQKGVAVIRESSG